MTPRSHPRTARPGTAYVNHLYQRIDGTPRSEDRRIDTWPAKNRRSTWNGPDAGIGKGGLYGNVIRIAPHLAVTEEEIQDGCEQQRRALTGIV